MRSLIFASCALFAVPLAAEAQSCRGIQAFDLGGGTKGCVVSIQENQITTTTSRDDGASTRVRRNAQPLVGAVMSGPVPANKSVVKKQMVEMCKLTQEKVRAQFADLKYNRVILVMDWQKAGGEVQAGFSSAKCRGFKFFDG
ncbi:hypothetical protein [Shimia sp. MMG029]|uniref:hypothetical protein n=1 Tax=Shimia sp. MMG029 TaxID=3021978 RepID=UPI0022FE04A8|nr:hypothetical protein [Shimia sp. MMG029]MDA5555188.1 hypothetical protein [Shimia sp. MMG029]